MSHLWESIGGRAVLMVVTTVPQSAQFDALGAVVARKDRPAGPSDRRNRLADASADRG